MTFAVIRDTAQKNDSGDDSRVTNGNVQTITKADIENDCNGMTRSEKGIIYPENEDLWNDEGIDECLSYDQYYGDKETDRNSGTDLWTEDEIDYSDVRYWDTDGLDEQLEFYRRFYGHKSCDDKDDGDNSHYSDSPCNSMDHDNGIFRNDAPYSDDAPFENWFLTSKDINYDEIYV